MDITDAEVDDFAIYEDDDHGAISPSGGISIPEEDNEDANMGQYHHPVRKAGKSLSLGKRLLRRFQGVKRRQFEKLIAHFPSKTTARHAAKHLAKQMLPRGQSGRHHEGLDDAGVGLGIGVDPGYGAPRQWQWSVLKETLSAGSATRDGTGSDASRKAVGFGGSALLRGLAAPVDYLMHSHHLLRQWSENDMGNNMNNDGDDDDDDDGRGIDNGSLSDESEDLDDDQDWNNHHNYYQQQQQQHEEEGGGEHQTSPHWTTAPGYRRLDFLKDYLHLPQSLPDPLLIYHVVQTWPKVRRELRRSHPWVASRLNGVDLTGVHEQLCRYHGDAILVGGSRRFDRWRLDFSEELFPGERFWEYVSGLEDPDYFSDDNDGYGGDDGDGQGGVKQGGKKGGKRCNRVDRKEMRRMEMQKRRRREKEERERNGNDNGDGTEPRGQDDDDHRWLPPGPSPLRESWTPLEEPEA